MHCAACGDDTRDSYGRAVACGQSGGLDGIGRDEYLPVVVGLLLLLVGIVHALLTRVSVVALVEGPVAASVCNSECQRGWDGCDQTFGTGCPPESGQPARPSPRPCSTCDDIRPPWSRSRCESAIGQPRGRCKSRLGECGRWDTTRHAHREANAR